MQNAYPHTPLAIKPAHSRRLFRSAVVTETYPPEVNGVANTVARVVTGLRARNHQVQLVRPRQPGDAANSRPDTAHEVLTRGVQIPMYSQLRMGLPCAGLLRRVWAERRPDVVHIATEGALGWSALRAATSLGLPVCSDFRTNFHAYSQFYGMAWLSKPIMAYLRRFHNRCHSTMVPTEALRLQLGAAGFRHLSTVARGVDTALFSPTKRDPELRRRWGVDDNNVVVLHVGRLAPEKNLALVLQAFSRLQSTLPHARLVVVGDGPSRADMQARCPQAVFAGFRAGEALAAHYASSDMFLFPSLTETFGNVTPEAMASGLPVVAFDDAAAGQLINHRASGMLAARADAHMFVQLATELAGNAAQRRSLGRCARTRALELSWDNVIRNVERIYGEAVAQVDARVGALVGNYG